MSYADLKGHANEIKSLAISQTVQSAKQAATGARGPGGLVAVGLVQDMADETFAETDKIFDNWLDLPSPYLLRGEISNISAGLKFLSSESYLSSDDAKKYAGGGGTSFNISQIEPTGAFMQGWHSGTSISYANFASLFGPITANLSMAVGVLRGACEAEVAIWTEARTSVDELAHATIDALNSVHDKSPKDAALLLTVLGAVAGIVAVPFTAGGSLVAAYSFAAIGAATSLGGAFVPDEENRPTAVGGSTPADIITDLNEKLGLLNDDIRAKESDVSKSLADSGRAFQAAMALPSGRSPVVMPRPTVANDPSLGGHD